MTGANLRGGDRVRKFTRETDLDDLIYADAESGDSDR